MRKTSKTKQSVSVVSSVAFLATYEATDTETFTDEFFWKINLPNLKYLGCELIRIHNTCHERKRYVFRYSQNRQCQSQDRFLLDLDNNEAQAMPDQIDVYQGIQTETYDNQQPWLSDDEFLQKYWMSRKNFGIVLKRIEGNPVLNVGHKKQAPPTYQLMQQDYVADQLLFLHKESIVLVIWLLRMSGTWCRPSKKQRINPFRNSMESATKSLPACKSFQSIALVCLKVAFLG